tara:strand:+ start:51 stop:287 length:237 start_codon:yes stop_codon:yes gene_type:complete
MKFKKVEKHLNRAVNLLHQVDTHLTTLEFDIENVAQLKFIEAEFKEALHELAQLKKSWLAEARELGVDDFDYEESKVK